MTVLEIFQIVDPTNYVLLMEEAKKQGVDNSEGFISATSIPWLIEGFVSWSRTKQGSRYWQGVADKYHRFNYKEFNSRFPYHI